MSRKLALIIGNSEYQDPRLARLATPSQDVAELAQVLHDAQVGNFDEVKTFVNETAANVRLEIESFFAEKKRDDLLLLYFSGHGVRDDQGHLYLTVKDTRHNRLRATAIPSGFITSEMDSSRSKRQVLILDCCHSGAFTQGMKGSTGEGVGTALAFKGTGYGRVVLTASDATQYAWEREGEQVIGEADNSVFTRHLIEGMRTGVADHDADGWVGLDELYDYVYEQVVNQTPKQTPHMWSFGQEGKIIIARNPQPVQPRPVELPLELRHMLESPIASARQAAVGELSRLLSGSIPGLGLAAQEALQRLVEDDSRGVANAAKHALATFAEAQSAKAASQAEARARDEMTIQEAEARGRREAAERAQQKAEAERLAAQHAEEARLAQAKAEAERTARDPSTAERKAQDETGTPEAANVVAESPAQKEAARQPAGDRAENADGNAKAQAARLAAEAVEVGRRTHEQAEPGPVPYDATNTLPQSQKARPARSRWAISVGLLLAGGLLVAAIAAVMALSQDAARRSPTQTALSVAFQSSMQTLEAVANRIATQTAEAAGATDTSDGGQATVMPSATNAPEALPTTPPPPETVAASNEWAMGGYDAQNTYWNRGETGLYPPLELAWRFLPMDAGAFALDRITIASGIAIITGMEDDGQKNVVFGVDADTGEQLWKYTLLEGGGAMDVAPAILDNLAFFGGQGDDNLYAVDIRTGQVQWMKPGMQNMYSLSPIIANGTLYVNTFDSVWALEPLTGREYWELKDEGGQSDLIYSDGILVKGSGNNRIVTGIDVQDGQVIWRTPGYGGYNLSASDELVFAIYTGDAPVILEDFPYSKFDRIAAFQIQDGSQVWEAVLNDDFIYGGMAVADSLLFVSSRNSKTVYVLDTTTGSVLTQKSFAAALENFAIANGVLYACAYDGGALYALNPSTLETISVYGLDDESCGNLVVSDGTLYMVQSWYGVAAFRSE
jgi:outer membrane protein assembly factor BamB